MEVAINIFYNKVHTVQYTVVYSVPVWCHRDAEIPAVCVNPTRTVRQSIYCECGLQTCLTPCFVNTGCFTHCLVCYRSFCWICNILLTQPQTGLAEQMNSVIKSQHYAQTYSGLQDWDVVHPDPWCNIKTHKQDNSLVFAAHWRHLGSRLKHGYLHSDTAA